ncbi:signal peptidase I [Ornithinimicrobium sediminis]|uniref:signal peptidase I n=1 Tax=Ornithinimicrobium sediminis TaxID=2904603 RepID=UPI001E61CB98|nr:signal peptidase I [Ornithinimicrobium sediminis]
MTTVRKAVPWLVLSVLAFGWVLFLRPVALGGPASYIVVSGESMEPTFYDGDLVVLRDRPAYEVGDIVTFPVPEGEPGAGSLVVHRIVGEGTDGFVMQGDNKDRVDDWTPSTDEVLGEAWVTAPNVGTMIAELRSPPFLAAIVGGLTTVMLLNRRPEEHAEPKQDKELEHA